MSPSQPIGLTARDLTCRSMVRWEEKDNRHVHSQSLQQKDYTGLLQEWVGFEQQVMKNFEQVKWSHHPHFLDYDLPSQCSSNNLHTEHFVCGEELSISGRFVQNALHVMTAVGKELGHDSVFGDWKATMKSNLTFGKAENNENNEGNQKRNKGKKKEDEDPKESRDSKGRKHLIPDYALMRGSDGEPRVVGEAKTPWNHDFLVRWKSFLKNDEAGLRRLLGQISNYMTKLELRYGFITNYEHTLFLKQGIENGNEILYCSPPVQYSTRGGSRTVSVRQCLLFLQTSVQGDKRLWHFGTEIPERVTVRLPKESTKAFKGRLEENMAKASHLFEENERSSSSGFQSGIEPSNNRGRRQHEPYPVSKSEMEGLGRGLQNLDVTGTSQHGGRYPSPDHRGPNTAKSAMKETYNPERHGKMAASSGKSVRIEDSNKFRRHQAQETFDNPMPGRSGFGPPGRSERSGARVPPAGPPATMQSSFNIGGRDSRANTEGRAPRVESPARSGRRDARTSPPGTSSRSGSSTEPEIIRGNPGNRRLKRDDGKSGDNGDGSGRSGGGKEPGGKVVVKVFGVADEDPEGLIIRFTIPSFIF